MPKQHNMIRHESECNRTSQKRWIQGVMWMLPGTSCARFKGVVWRVCLLQWFVSFVGLAATMLMASTQSPLIFLLSSLLSSLLSFPFHFVSSFIGPSFLPLFPCFPTPSVLLEMRRLGGRGLGEYPVTRFHLPIFAVTVRMFGVSRTLSAQSRLDASLTETWTRDKEEV